MAQSGTVSTLGAVSRLVSAAMVVVIAGSPAFSQSGATFRIGMVTDMSSAYSDLSGKYSVAAAQMAIDDFGGQVLGKKIEFFTADHQMKPSVGSALVTEWFDREGVSAIFGLPGSSVALAAQATLKDRPKRLVVITIGQTNELNGKSCQPNGIHWAPDFYTLGVAATRYVTQSHGKAWYVMVQDTAAGPPARAAALAGIEAGGGRVLGDVRVPVNAGDVSSFVLQAQASRAENIAIGFGGGDLVNIIKAATQFGISRSGVTFVASGGLFATDVAAMGLELAAGTTFATPFYSEMNDEARAWSKRFFEKTGRYPAFSHVAEYEAITHYLHAVQKVGTDDATVVVPIMKETPVNSFALKDGKIRENNQLVRPIYLAKVKTPAQSKSPGDYVDLLAVVSAKEGYSPIEQSECPMVKKPL